MTFHGPRRIAAAAIYHVHPRLAGPIEGWSAHLRRAAAMGFAEVCVAGLDGADPDILHRVAEACREARLGLLLDATVAPADAAMLATSAAAGVTGFRCLSPDRLTAGRWRELIAEVRETAPACRFLAWTPGLTRPSAAGLRGAGFDAVFASTAWWDGRAAWLVEEHETLRRIAPVVSVVSAPGEHPGTRLPDHVDRAAACRWSLGIAAATGSGLFVPMGFEMAMGGGEDSPTAFARAAERVGESRLEQVAQANRLAARIVALGLTGEMRQLSSAGQCPSALLRADRADVREAGSALLVLANGDLRQAHDVADWQAGLPAAAGAAFGIPVLLGDRDPTAATLAPGEVRLLTAEALEPVRLRTPPGRVAVRRAAQAPRIVIDNVSPAVDGGRFAAKRVVGELVDIEADIFADGHERLAAALLWRPADGEDWRRVPMRPLGNDRWRATLALHRVGRHHVTVEAWWDVWGTYRHELEAKRTAGRDVRLEVAEGRLLLADAVRRAEGEAEEVLSAAVRRLADDDIEAGAAVLLDAATREAAAETDARPFLVRHGPPLPIDVERPQAAFASWYEMFPRSATDDPRRHGTFDDVIGRLPAIRAMGFDVLYFPPIHPIGRKNRKGRNNSLAAAPDDVGSPYAIGSAEGGHDAIHPQLGTIEDFRRLRAAAADNGLELALDFAIQCSPDHPWLAQHPGWFRWRPDGSLRYAENPPKKYEDIVNVDFYAADAVPDLWLALRDVVLFWVGEGVRTFRVDNPHTKPLAFWEWLIADVRARHPEAIFLSEAFTRPKMMYRLAKLGFSQSYTYFTWRNTKRELTDYLVELTTTAPRDFFRPHFFVNTPDINPVFLQTAGRAGFLIRAALAATLSGLWGVYSGFELCEAAPLPGREEYLDSEKYEIRVRDPDAPGNIVAEITLLNRLRRAYPALQDHRRLAFYNAFDDRVLLYGKAMDPPEDMILVAVCLDPHAVVECAFEVPLWEWGLADDATVEVEDLMRGGRFRWTGKRQRLRLDPADLPFAIWRIAPPGDPSP